jgi:hypothetical protein
MGDYNMKANKYEYNYYIQGHYGVYGWEDVDCHDSRKDARDSLKCYRENDPQHPYRMILRRELDQEVPNVCR